MEYLTLNGKVILHFIGRVRGLIVDSRELRDLARWSTRNEGREGVREREKEGKVQSACVRRSQIVVGCVQARSYLVVENPETGADRSLVVRERIVSHADARLKIRRVWIRRKHVADGGKSIGIRVPQCIGVVRSLVRERIIHNRVERSAVPCHVTNWIGRKVITDTEVQGQFGCDLPIVLEIRGVVGFL